MQKKTRKVYPEKNREIIEKSRKGDSRSQHKLYNLYVKAMLNVCYRMMGNLEEAEDMLQEAMIEAFSKLHTFRYESAFGAWLKRIMVNKCINEINRKKANLTYLDDLSHFDNKPVDDEKLPELNVKDIKKAMTHLPEGNRIIFSLYLIEGYDHREIAQILNTSESNSKTQYMRAKRKVKEILTTTYHD